MSRKRQKILYLFYEPLLSGISRHIISLLQALKGGPYEFWVLCSTRDEKIREALLPILGEGRVRIVPSGRFFSFSGFLEARRIICSRRIDTVHIHNLQSAPWAYAAVVLSGCRRVIFTPHVFNIDTRFFKLFFRLLWQFIRPFTAMYIAVSKTQHDLMLSWRIAGPDRVKFVANNINESELKNRSKEERQTIRNNNGIPETAVVVTQMARLDRQKNPLFLIKVAELIKEQAPEVMFFLIGEGPLTKPVKMEIQKHGLNDKVILNGYRHDGIDLLRASDIVTLTSRWEGLPYVLIEAAYFEKPVIGTDIPGLRDLVENGKSGYLVDTEEEFATKLIQLAQSKDLREQMGREGYLRNESLFNVSNTAGLMHDIYFNQPRSSLSVP